MDIKEQILYTIDKALKWVRLQKENKMLKGQLKKVEMSLQVVYYNNSSIYENDIKEEDNP